MDRAGPGVLLVLCRHQHRLLGLQAGAQQCSGPSARPARPSCPHAARWRESSWAPCTYTWYELHHPYTLLGLGWRVCVRARTGLKGPPECHELRLVRLYACHYSLAPPRCMLQLSIHTHQQVLPLRAPRLAAHHLPFARDTIGCM